MFELRNILKVESIGFIDGLNVGCERERGSTNEPQNFGLSHWMEGVVIN